MALKEVAVQGATFSYQAPVTGAPPTPGAPSTKVLAGGSGVFQDGLQVTIPVGVTDGTCTTTAVGIGNISATSLKVDAEGKKVLRVGDSVTVAGITGVLSGGSACALTVTVEITNAGQAKVKAE